MLLKIPFISTLFTYFKTYRAYTGAKIYYLIAAALFSGLFEGIGLSIAIPLLSFENRGDAQNQYTKFVFDLIEKLGMKVSITSILIILVSIFALKTIFLIFQTVISNGITTNLVKDLKYKFCSKIEHVDYEYYTNKSIGFFNNIINNEIHTVVNGLSCYIVVIISLIYIGIYLTSAFLINRKLTLIVIVIAFFIFFLLRDISLILKKISYKVTQTNSEIQSITIQKLYNFKYLKATNNFKPVLEQIKQKLHNNQRYYFKSAIFTEIPRQLIEMMTILFSSVLIWYYVGIKNNSIISIIVTLIFFNRAMPYILGIQNNWQRFSAYRGAVDIVEKAFREIEEHADPVGLTKIQDFKKAVLYKDIDFAFGNKKALNNINMAIPHNKTIGIVGHSGSGKTTLLDILTGLLHPVSGSLYIDGISFSDVNVYTMRDMIGYITQEPIIFNDSIANNISLWNYNSDSEEAKRKMNMAIELSNSRSIIADCENGIDTVIGEKGVKLSGGQRQRIAIARELYKEPEILILDEATSALDSQAELNIQQSIESIMGKCTMVIISHRLSTVKNCDIIYVIENGRIIESGSFRELYDTRESQFRKMCIAQSLHA